MKVKTKFLHALAILLNILHANVSTGNAVLINHLTDLNGLPQNSIKGLLMDERGYLWIATEHGMARYDGNNIKTYFDSTLGSNRFYGIFQGRNPNEIYAVSEHTALFLIKGGRLKKTQLEGTGNWSRLTDVGKEWLTHPGTEATNVFVMDGKTYSINAEFKIQLIDQGAKHTSKENEESNVPKFLKSSISTSSNIFVFANVVYGIAKKDGQFVITELLSHFEDVSNISFFWYSTQTQTLFLGTLTNGLYIYKINSGIKIPRYSRNRNYAAQVAIDDHHIFSAGDIIGLDTLHTLKQVRKSINNYALLKDHFGRIYYPAKSRGIYMISELSDKAKPVKVFNETGLWMYEDQYYRMWIYDKHGIHVYANSSPGEKILIHSFSRFTNVKGYITYNMERRGFFIVNNDHIYRIGENLQLMDSIQIDRKLKVRNLYISNTGIFWLATYGQGVRCVKNKVTYELPLDFEKYMLLSHEIFQDRHDNYWITTNRGLFKIKAGLVENNLFNNRSRNIHYNYYSTYDGLHTNEFNGGAFPGVVKMGNGFYSLPTISGLAWINPDNILDPTLNSDILIEEVIADNVNLDPEKPLVFDKHISRLTINLSIVYWGDQKNIQIRYRLPGLDKDWNILNAPYSITYSNLPGGNQVLEIQVMNQLQVNQLVKKNIQIDAPLRFHQEWWFYVLCAIGFIGIIGLYSNYKHKRIKRLNANLERQIRERTNELIIKNQKISDSLQLLERKQEVLDTSISIKDKVMSIFSHNIVGPLKFITVLTDNMTRDEVVDMKNLKAIDTTSKSLLLHSVDLLAWVKTQDEQYRIQKELISLKDFVPLKMDIFRPMAEAKGIRFELRIPENLELTSDKQLLNIVFYNIVDNAIKHTSNGSITIEALKSQHAIKIIFTDTGAGMTETQVRRINAYAFNPLKRFSGENENGTGIGWFIINDCLSLLKAYYTVKSTPAGGTMVTLSFPV